MILKIGNDIIETERIQKICTKFPDRFKNRVFTQREIEYCESKGASKYQSYSARFAAKEAVYKAISGCLDNKFDISWRDIEILNDKYGRPYAVLNNNISQVESIDVSLSHIKEYAIATAIVTLAY